MAKTYKAKNGGDNPGHANAAKAKGGAKPEHIALKEGWMHHHLVLALGIFVVMVVAAVLIVSSIIGTSKVSTTQIMARQAALASNQTLDVNQLKMLVASGIEANELDITYSGNATFTISVIRLRAPISVAFQRYYNNSRIDINVSGLPLIKGNLSFIDIKNGTNYYSCYSGGENSNGQANYTCSYQEESGTLFSILNMSNQTSTSPYGSLAIHFAQTNQSTYGGMRCTNTAGYFSYSNLTSQGQAQQEVPSSGNLTFESCVSDSYVLPLTLYAHIEGVKSSAISSATLDLHETYIGTNSSANIAWLPAAPT